MARRKERRTRRRRTTDQEIPISVLGAVARMDIKKTDSEVRMVDICETGMGIICGIPLHPGQLVKFPYGKNQDMPSEVGIVMWAVDTDGQFRAGVKFI